MLKHPFIEKKIKFDDIVDENNIGDAIINDSWPGFKEDYLLIHSLIRTYLPNSFFEIGTSQGIGTNIICNAMKGNPVYSIELPYMRYPENQMQPLKNPGHKCNFPYTQIIGDSTDYPYENYYPIEGWFIDGNHTYDNVFKESISAFKSSPKVVIWHDVDIVEVRQAIIDCIPDWYQLFTCPQTRIAWAVPKKILVYTAISGDFDDLSERFYPPTIAYLDKNIKTNWEVRIFDTVLDNPRLTAKFVKVCPHKLIDSEFSLWIDGNLDLLVHPRYLFKYLENADIATPIHPFRSCIYHEGIEIVKNKLDDQSIVYNQLNKYNKKGLHPDWLPWCGVILRRHNGRVMNFNEIWWNEIKNHSIRDQLSYCYSVKQAGINFSLEIPRDFLNVRPHRVN